MSPHTDQSDVDQSSGSASRVPSISRRNLIGAATVALSTAGGMAFIVTQSEEASASVDGSLSATLNTASASTDDGTITGIDLADPGTGIDIQWEGFDTADPSFTVELGVEITGTANGTSTSTEYLLSGTAATSSGTSGQENFSWSTIWGQSTLDITTHSSIALTDFESGTDGGTKTNNVKVTLRLSHADLSSDITQTANADISITNIAPDADVGGTIDVQITE